MQILFAGALLLGVPQAAGQTMVQAAVPGSTMTDADGRRIGKIVRTLPDGSVRVLMNDRLVDVPGDTVRNDGGKTATTLKRGELGKLAR